MSTLYNILREHSSRLKEGVGYTFLEDGEDDASFLSYRDLDRKARAIAAALQSRDLAGKRVGLFFPPGLAYIEAFWGCLYAGAVAVPAYPPGSRRMLPRIQSIIDDCNIEVVLCSESVKSRADRAFGAGGGFAGLDWLVTDSIDMVGVEAWREPEIEESTLAFLQYTSGSTGTPKGVMVSHGNLIANERMIEKAFGHDDQTVVAGWLPPYHDMGLIGNILQPLYLGVSSIMMAPATAIQRPLRWLKSISKYKATTSGCPNFFYDLCVEKVADEELTGLDLSSWKVAFNGAEPVNYLTMERFYRRFSSCGFRSETSLPCYGLAEGTLIVTGASVSGNALSEDFSRKALENGEARLTSETSGEAKRLVSSGFSVSDCEVLIVDPKKREVVESGSIGEIWVNGDNVAMGYWGRKELSDETFRAKVANTGNKEYLRTGDLGFAKDGEIFVVGRIKDLIIVRGRNYYPHDIEEISERSHESLRVSGAAAFSIDENGEERLVLLQELDYRSKPDGVEVVECVRKAVLESAEIQPSRIVLLKPGSLPKTSSGKIQRSKCKKLFLEGELKVAFDSEVISECSSSASPAEYYNDLEGRLALVWQDILKLENAPSPKDDFFSSGGDSLTGMQLVARTEELFAVKVGVDTLFDNSSLAAYREYVETLTISSVEESSVEEEKVFYSNGKLLLCPAQQRIWFYQQWDSKSCLYNIPATVRLRGDLNRKALENAFSALVEKHEAIRTRFSTDNGKPVQEFLESVPVELMCDELGDIDPESEVERLAREEACRPFDLNSDALLRIRLLRISSFEHVLLICVHHIIADAWALDLMLSELASLYESFSSGLRVPVRKPEVSYSDFIKGQLNDALSSSRISDLNYWKQQLKGAPLTLDFPYAKPRGEIQTFDGGRIDFKMPKSVQEAAKNASSQHGVTLYMYLLSVFKTLVYRHTGQADIVVGSPIAGRHRAGYDKIVGLFINTLALRTEVSGEASFKELLERVKKVTLGGYAHQETAFEELFNALELDRNLRSSPVFQVLFQLQNAPINTIRMGHVVATPTETDNGTVKLDIVFNIVDTDDGFACSIRYNKALFEEEQIDSLRCHYQNLLEETFVRPFAKLDSFDILGEEERKRILLDWNDTKKDFEKSDLLHEQFESQVRSTPEATALVCDGVVFTYYELNQRANKLARWMRTKGIGDGSYVAVCMERSWEMVVSLLATLKSGGAYVPLDPDYPIDRLEMMYEDLGKPLALVQERFESLFQNIEGRFTLCLDVAWDWEVDSQGATNLNVAMSAESLAYVIYTSGSTGKPKGAANRHVSICNRINWMQDEYRLTASDNVLQKTPYSFDVSVWEFFWPLVTGARLTMAKPGGHRDGRYIVDTVISEGITTMHFVPSMMRLFLQEGNLDRCTSLRQVFASGEALPGELATEFAGKVSAELHNLYGPTEAAVDVTYHACSSHETDRIVPIGRPISNTSIYILNPDRKPVPIGVPGELYIGGVNLAQCYLNRPDLTEEKFVRDPFAKGDQARMYRTGDSCCFRSDGTIDYIERLDFQVKLRGFRIELGEIEEALRNVGGISDTVVLVKEGANIEDSFLCAYFVGEKSLSVNGIREALLETLPEYMVPTSYIPLDVFPLSSNGKLDRKALPEPSFENRLKVDNEYVEPADALELYLASLWKEAVGIDRVGASDNFFEVGGNSIQGAIVINRLQERLKEIIHIVAIFDYPTVEKLSGFLRESYGPAVSREFGIVTVAEAEDGMTDSGDDRIDERDIEYMRNAIPSLPPFPTRTEKRNSKAIFILSPPRSGSTLLRVLLGGHPGLFAPPELELLGFNTLQDRKEAFPGRDSFSLEGTVRSLMELTGVDVDGAKSMMERYENQNMSVKEFYSVMQDRLGDRLLVDKTPSYPLDINALHRAEEDFEDAVFIHLVRHPLAVMRSFDEARLEQVFCRYDHPYNRLELSELIWTICQQNIQEFLKTIPSHRQLKVRFEDLVGLPRQTISYITHFLELNFDASMLDPYQEKGDRMTDGLHKDSRMLGDVKFHRYKGIESSVVERWRETMDEGLIGDVTREMASQLGYRIDERKTVSRSDHMAISANKETKTPAILSFSQERLWFLAQLEPESFAYNVPGVVELRGEVNRDAMENAILAIIKRHESLRTVFPKLEGRPSLFVSDSAKWNLGYIDASELGGRSYGESYLVKESKKPFDLMHGPLIRAQLIKISDGTHFLYVNMHHIISDGWSLNIFVRELKANYVTLLTGESLVPASLPIQYSDYAMWQRSRMDGEALEQKLDFWGDKLSGELPTLELPMDRPRLAKQSFAGSRLSVEVGGEQMTKVRSLASELGTTAFTVLLSSFKVFLHQVSGERDLIVGSPVANRHLKEVENLIGCFMNTLVLRTSIEDGMSFRDYLDHVKTVSRESYVHQDVPFEKIVERVNPVREMNRSPIFQVMFSYQNAETEDLSIPGLDIDVLEIDNGTSKFDLSLNLREENGKVLGYFEYCSDLFEESTIEVFSKLWTGLLDSLVDDSRSPIVLRDVAVESDSGKAITLEDKKRLESYNDTSVEYPKDKCIHELVEIQASQKPDAIALVFGNQKMSYGDLNSKANQLAWKLRNEYSVSGDSIVAVMVERSMEMIVGMLAVLKAGGAYLPIDPTYPKERIRYMLEDSECKVVLSQQKLLPKLKFDGTALSLDESDLYENSPIDNLGSLGSSDSLAYLIYTSGSTGRPKGVAIEHRNVVNFMQGMKNAVGLAQGQSILSATTICFDIFVLESLVPLMLGMEIVVVSEEEQRDPAQILARIANSGVEVLQATPSLMKVVFGAADTADKLGGVKKFLVGGEAFPKPLYEQMRSLTSSEIYNVYGPTETTVWSTVARLDGADIDIGNPIANTQIFIVKEGSIDLAPLGEVGELCIGGDGLARGYWNREELTAEKFVSSPIDSGDRMYRTGDLARWLPSGKLECLGRIDGQVKIRGHRIEVGEIEAVLEKIDGLDDAVVVAREIRNQNSLVAYYTAAQRMEPGLLRKALEKTLPVYMIPAHFEYLNSIPLTSNGKVDRKSLPAPTLQMKPGRLGLKPRNDAEEVVSSIWKHALDLEEVGVEDNFFDMGGNSLLIVEIQSKLETEFGKSIAVAEVFNRPTVAELAKYFSSTGSESLKTEDIGGRADRRKVFAGRERTKRKNALRRN
ncbi:amino acid adenylation domain-containing protein [Puniceicoccaceae bacterium K14]|nr:amino acid adenylation domain-containing protein [Puniceicoccaceae bacterium K14]